MLYRFLGPRIIYESQIQDSNRGRHSRSQTLHPTTMAYDSETRWKITDIDVPFGCMLRWLLKLIGCYVIITVALSILAAMVLGILSLLGAGILHSAVPSTHSNHFSDPNYWKH